MKVRIVHLPSSSAAVVAAIMRKTMELAAAAGEFAGAAAECYGQRAHSPQPGQTSYWLLDVVHKLGSHDCLQKILDVMLLSARENAAGRSFVVHREDGLLESALNALALKNSELEKELQDVSAKCAKYEGRASSSHQRSLEMEDLIQTSHSKAEGAEKKIVELELLHEAANYRIQELEEQVSLSDARCRDADAESKK